MTNRQTEDPVGQSPMLRMAGILAEKMPDEFKGLLEILTQQGDLDVVRELHAAGLLASSPAQAAVLPIPVHAADRQAALDLVRDIVSLDGKPDTDAALYHFSNARDEDSIRVLAMLGFDPNEWMNPSLPVSVTPLSAQFSKSAGADTKNPERLPAIMAILEDLRLRDVVPLKERMDYGMKEWNIFQSAANRAANAFAAQVYGPVMDELIKVDWPDSWRSATGRAIIEFFPQGKMPNLRSQSQLLVGLMMKASFADESPWVDMLTRLNAKGDTTDFGSWLCDNMQCGSKGVAAVKNMVAQGLSVDEVTFNLYAVVSMSYGTLLHSAIMKRNDTMIEVLLDLGASPNAIVLPHPNKPPCDHQDVGLSAVDLAEKHFPEALPLLHAKRAKDAIGRAVEQAAKANSAAASRG